MQPRESKREISREKFDAVLLDLDGVITDTASLHAACWKQVFDEYLRERTARNGETFRPFDLDVDYRLYVDGKPRFDGVRDFLASRGMRLPEGSHDDPPDAETVGELGNRKDDLVHKAIEDTGVRPYEGSVRLIQQLHRDGFQNCRRHLELKLRRCPEGRRAGGLLRRQGRRQRDPDPAPRGKARPGYVPDGRVDAAGRAGPGGGDRGCHRGGAGRSRWSLRPGDRSCAQGQCRGASAPRCSPGDKRSG